MKYFHKTPYKSIINKFVQMQKLFLQLVYDRCNIYIFTFSKWLIRGHYKLMLGELVNKRVSPLNIFPLLTSKEQFILIGQFHKLIHLRFRTSILIIELNQQPIPVNSLHSTFPLFSCFLLTMVMLSLIHISEPTRRS